jgi:hypothetical protein
VNWLLLNPIIFRDIVNAKVTSPFELMVYYVKALTSQKGKKKKRAVNSRVWREEALEGILSPDGVILRGLK